MSTSPADPCAIAPEQLLAHVEWVRLLAASLVADPSDADDVAQRAWLETLERPPPRASRLRHWLALVTRNAARKLGRARRTRELHESRQPPPGVAPSTAELVERAELQRQVVGELLALADPYRATLLRRFFEGLEAGEIARRGGVPVETVRTRIKRGLAQLRTRLAGDGSQRRELSHLLAPLLAPTLTVAKGVAVSVTSKLLIATTCAIVASLAVWQAERSRGGSLRRDDAARPAAAAPATAQAESVAASRDNEVAAAVAPAVARLLPDSIAGIVVDEQDAPVAGARVFVGRDADEWFARKERLFDHLGELESAAAADSDSQRFHGVSGPDGRFRFDQLPISGRLTFAAIDSAIGIAWRNGVPLPAESEIRLVLQSGTVITGRVTAPDGRIEPNVSIEIGAFDREFDSEMKEEWIEPGQGVVVCRTRTDAHGEYRSLPLRYARIEVRVELTPKVDDPTVLCSRSPVVRVEPTEREHRVDVVLAPRRTLRGRILDLDGEPARLKERLLPKLTERERATQNSESYEVEAWTMDPRISLHLIEDPHPRSRHNTVMWGRIDVDHDTFEIEPWSTDERWLVMVVRTGIVGFAEIVDPERGPDLRVDLAKVPARIPWGRLRIHVFSGADGGDVAQAEVNASYFINNGLSTSHRFAYEKTDAKGEAVCELPAGRSPVHVSAKGFVAVQRSVDVRPDAETAADFELVPAAISLHGTVVDETGKPLQGIAITVYKLEEERWEVIADSAVRSDDSGRFELGSLPDESLEIVAFDWDRAPAHVASDEGSSERVVRITMARGVEVKLETRTATGGAVPHALFRICDKGGVPLVDSNAPLMSSGLFDGVDAKFHLPAEELDFTAWSPDAPPVTLRVTPQPGGTITFTLKDF